MKKFILNSASLEDYLKVIRSLILSKIPFNTFGSKEEYEDYHSEHDAPQILIECDEANIPYIKGSFDYFDAE